MGFWYGKVDTRHLDKLFLNDDAYPCAGDRDSHSDTYTCCDKRSCRSCVQRILHEQWRRNAVYVFTWKLQVSLWGTILRAKM